MRSTNEVVVLTRLEALEGHVEDWEELAAESVEPNVFYEPWMLQPAAEAFARTRALHFVLIRRQPKGPPRKGNRPILIGLFPLELLPPCRSVPLARFALWRHPHCYLTSPLLRRGYGREALAAFFDWLAEQRRALGPLYLEKVPGEGALHQLLVEELARRGWLADVERRYTRAVLGPGGADADSYIARALTGKRRKELRRQQRRLSELGAVEVRTLGPDADLEGWLEEFVEMEAGGWKGELGHPFRDDPDSLAFLRAFAAEGHRRGRLLMTALTVGGESVAYKLSLLSGEAAFAFKIAHDPNYRRHSPGVLLELDTIERVCRDPAVRWMDSCAGFEHPMIDGLWTERRTIEHLSVSASRRGDALLSVRLLGRLGRRLILGR